LELVDPVSASPLEPFAPPDSARKEPGEEPNIAQNIEHSTMALNTALDPAAACEDCDSNAVRGRVRRMRTTWGMFSYRLCVESAPRAVG